MQVKTQVYIATVTLAAAGLFLVASRLTPLAPEQYLPVALVLGVAIAVTRVAPVQVAVETKMTVDTAVIFGSLLVAPLPVALLAAAVAAAVSDAWLRRAWYNVVFNTAKLVAATALAGFVVLGLGGGPLVDFRDLGPIAAGGTLFLLVEVALVAGVISLHANFPFPGHFRRLLRAAWLQYAALLMLGALSSTLWVKAPVALPLLAIPLFFVHRSYTQQAALRKQTRDTLIMLADTIDSRDFYTAGHCYRVARLASELATEMGLSEPERETVYLAARLHDIGKIGIRDDLLAGKDALDDEAQAELERHPVVGMEMLTELDQFFEVKEAVVFHHKRYDGTGYPRHIALPSYGLPLSAAIIAVADAFDAMTSGRSYRTAYPEPVALREIRRNAGTQFHPGVVAALMTLKGCADAKETAAPDRCYHPTLAKGAVQAE